MTAIPPNRLTRKRRIREYNGRGAIYAWLRAHHGDVARLRDVEARPWLALVRDLVADGVHREDGNEPTVKNVARVWDRVCRDIKADAAAAKPKRKFPSRISPDWRPQILSGSLVPRPGPPASDLTAAASRRASPGAGSNAPIPLDAPFEFATVDDQGNQLEEGKVFYGGKVRTRQGAEQSERMQRRMRLEDYYR